MFQLDQIQLWPGYHKHQKYHVLQQHLQLLSSAITASSEPSSQFMRTYAVAN